MILLTKAARDEVLRLLKEEKLDRAIARVEEARKTVEYWENQMAQDCARRDKAIADSVEKEHELAKVRELFDAVSSLSVAE